MPKILSTVLLQTLRARRTSLIIFLGANILLGVGLGAMGLGTAAPLTTLIAHGLLAIAALVVLRGLTAIFSDRLALEAYGQARLILSRTTFWHIKESRKHWSNSEILDRLTSDLYTLLDALLSTGLQSASHAVLTIITLGYVILNYPLGLLVVGFGGVLYLIFSMLTRTQLQKKILSGRTYDTKVFQAEKNFIEGHDYLVTSGYFPHYFRRLQHNFEKWLQFEMSKSTILNFGDNAAWAVRYVFVVALSTPMALAMNIQGRELYWIFLAVGTLSQLTWSLRRAVDVWPHYKRSLELLRHIPDEEPGRSSTSTMPLSNASTWSAHNLRVAYDPRQVTRTGLGPLHFIWQQGDRIWIRGQSGSGKTTFLKALLGLHPLLSGELQTPQQGANTAYVEQEPFFFESEPLWVNLGLQENATVPAELIVGLGLENFFAHLPAGLHTMIGSDGVKPSRGQKMRLAILRALMQNPYTLILDEPTAGLESPLARAILKFVCEKMAHGVFVVADHREDLIAAITPTGFIDCPSTTVQNHPPSAEC